MLCIFFCQLFPKRYTRWAMMCGHAGGQAALVRDLRVRLHARSVEARNVPNPEQGFGQTLKMSLDDTPERERAREREREKERERESERDRQREKEIGPDVVHAKPPHKHIRFLKRLTCCSRCRICGPTRATGTKRPTPHPAAHDV